MVSCETENTASLFNCCLKAAKLKVHTFHRTYNSVEYTSVSNHITVRVVQTDVVIFSAFNSLNYLVSNFCTLHPWALLEWNNIRWNFNISFKILVEFTRAVTVEEVSNVTIFLSFRNCHKMNASLCKIFTHCAVNARWVYEELSRLVVITIVFHHTCIFNSRAAYAVKVREVVFFESSSNFKRAVTAEVKEDYAVAVNNRAYRLSVFCDYKLVHILVEEAGIFTAVSIDSFSSACKLTTISKNVSVPSALYHAPVSTIAVHSDVHTSTARSNLIINITELSKEFFKRLKIFKS